MAAEIDELTYQLKTISNDYHEGNKISVDKVKEITNQGWYKAECSDSLGAMIKEDPFSYASVADASVTAGISLFNISGKKEKMEYDEGNVKVTKSTSLLGASITGSVGASAAVNFDISSTRVLDFGEVNVNAVTVKLGGALGLGVDVYVTLPMLTGDMPWED